MLLSTDIIVGLREASNIVIQHVDVSLLHAAPNLYTGGKGMSVVACMNLNLATRRDQVSTDTSCRAYLPSSDALVTSSFLFLVIMPGATSSVLATNSDALVTTSAYKSQRRTIR